MTIFIAAPGTPISTRKRRSSQARSSTRTTRAIANVNVTLIGPTTQILSRT